MCLYARDLVRGGSALRGKRRPGYDHLDERCFDFVPLWGIAVVTGVRTRCGGSTNPRCGVTVEQAPRAHGKTPMTVAMQVFLARGARRLSGQEVADVFGVSWDRVYRAVEAVVAHGLAHRDLSGIQAIGVDEAAWAKGRHWAAVVYQLNGESRRLLHVSEGRRVKSPLRFFLILKRAKINARESIRCVCSDMHKAYLRAIGRILPEALHILDRYHIAANLSQGLNQVRADESGELKAQGWKKLKRSRWGLLRRREKLKHKQPYKPGGILQWDLPAVRAYLLKESRHGLWDYKSPTDADRCLDAWCRQAMPPGSNRSRKRPVISASIGR